MSNSSKPIIKTDILLVDDRKENLLALESVLEAPEYNLIKVNSGKEALRYLLDHEPALILMDIQMPDLDGYETTSLIKKSMRTRDIPIIFVTAINQEQSQVHQGYDYGAIDYIYKPYDPHILKAKVRVFAELALKTKRLIDSEKQLRISEKRERDQQFMRIELKSMRRYQAQQRKYLDLVEGINHGIVWSVDADSLVMTFVSPSIENILGYTKNQWAYEHDFFVRHIHPDDRAAMLAVIERLKTEKGNVELDHRLLRKDGQEVWFHTGLRLSQKGDDTGVEIRGLSVEITKIKQAEEILRTTQKHSDFLATASLLLSETLDFQSTLPHIAKLAVPTIADWCIIQLKDEDGKFLPDIITHSEQEKIMVMSDHLHTHFDDTAQPLLYPTLPPDFLNLPQSLGLRSAMIIPLAIHEKVFGYLILLNAESGHAFNKTDFLMAQDLSRRIMMAFTNARFYEQAQNAIHVRDEFLSIASHELKTPLTPLKLQIQMVMRMLEQQKAPELNPEKIAKLLHTSEKQISRLTLLIDELLDIAKINNGKLQLNIEEFDLNEMIRDILDRFDGQITQAKCETVIEIPEQIKVRWDRFRMEQVVINLLTNAIKYGQGHPIHIRVCKDQDKIRISVKDHGIGIAQKDLERIFARFERAVSGKNFAGLGLGLFIASQLAEAHKGHISVESELGSGSTFTLEAPQFIPLENNPVFVNRGTSHEA